MNAANLDFLREKYCNGFKASHAKARGLPQRFTNPKSYSLVCGFRGAGQDEPASVAALCDVMGPPTATARASRAHRMFKISENVPSVSVPGFPVVIETDAGQFFFPSFSKPSKKSSRSGCPLFLLVPWF